MKTNITELVQGVGGLVTLPDVFIRINRLVENPNSTTSEIAKAIGQDPSFTVRLLRVANSSFYGLSSSIDTIPKAVSVIGTSQIRSLALATTVASSFDGLPNTLVSMENFWEHSLYCALVARSLAKQAHKCDADAVFTAALLHDIGELVIFNRLPQQAKEALLLVLDSADELPVHQAEQQIMGFDHAQVGGELARQWKLPPMLEECIEYHHNVGAALRFPREVALVHIANILALMAEVRTPDPGDVPPIDPLAWEIAGLDTATIIRSTVDEALAEIAEAEQLFLGK
ncbi:MAG: HDOD domain-containing protein [Gallionellaceae bacterium]|nr:MAG: HDOD domain-containing protein [Gallionellaceae bacterium]